MKKWQIHCYDIKITSVWRHYVVIVQSPLAKGNLQLIINIGLKYETLKEQKSEAWIKVWITEFCQNFPKIYFPKNICFSKYIFPKISVSWKAYSKINKSMKQHNKMCNIWAKQRKTAIRIENCVDNWKKSDGFENNAFWRIYDVIVISWFDTIMSLPLWGHSIHIIIIYIS